MGEEKQRSGHQRSVDRRTSDLKTSPPCLHPEKVTGLRCPHVDQFLLGATARTALTQSGGKAIDRNLELQTTRVYAVNYFSATHSRALHPSDSPPQRDGSSCPSRARKRAPKSMPASPASRASEDDETVFVVVGAVFDEDIYIPSSASTNLLRNVY